MAASLRRSRSSPESTRKRTRSSAGKLVPQPHHNTDAFIKPKYKLSPPRIRPVLTPIHLDARPIRAIPSRTSSHSPTSSNSGRWSRSKMANEIPHPGSYVGRKRKRAHGGNENYYNGRGIAVYHGSSASRDRLKTKRRKSVVTAPPSEGRMELDQTTQEDEEEEETEQFSDNTEEAQNEDSEQSSEEEQVNEEEDDEEEEEEDNYDQLMDADGDANDPSDNFLLSFATPWQLRQLRKDRLVQLYALLPHEDEDDAEDGDRLTKNELIDAVLEARPDRPHSKSSTPPLPSPPRMSRRRPAGSPPSSSVTDGHDAGAEESDGASNVRTTAHHSRRGLRRKVSDRTDLGAGSATSGPTTRGVNKSVSMGRLERSTGSAAEKEARKARFAGDVKSPHHKRDINRRSSALSSYRSSPSSPGATERSMPPALSASSSRTTRSRSSVKTKPKQVEFSEADAEDTEEEPPQPQTVEDGDTELESEGGWEDDDDLSVIAQCSTTPRDIGRGKKSRARLDSSPVRLRRPGSPSVTRRGAKSEPLLITQARKSLFQPSPRKLRTGKYLGGAGSEPLVASRTGKTTRSRLARRVKTGGSLQEAPSEEDEDEELVSGEEDDEVDQLMDEDAASSRAKQRALDVFDDGSELTELEDDPDVTLKAPVEEDEEATDSEDDFGSQAEESPPPVRRTASGRGRRVVSSESVATVITRSRSRTNLQKAEVSSGSKKALRKKTPEHVVEEDEQEEEEEEEEEEDAEPETVDVEPRVLRNGKVVGVDVVEEEDEEEDEIIEDVEDAVEEDEEDTEEAGESLEEDDENAEEAEEEEAEEEFMDAEEEAHVEEVDEDEMEDDYDLSDATAKSLARLRRDDLVRLCETRDLEAEGTKNQLVQNLLQWREQQSDRPSSCTQPSSRASTARAPSTARPGRHGHHSGPVLLRSDRVHVLQPPTPDPNEEDDSESVATARTAGTQKKEEELELDLESLGLEDKEIPAEKLVKLEKIGSGGFKDVYIGKFRGRKVAIAEFRGNLTSMDIKELKLLRDFDHPNVVRFLGVSIPENSRETPVMLVNELCANGDLFDYIRNVPPPTLRKVLNLMLDISRGIQYLHLRKPSVIHRDCKSSNILITSKVTAKIADFGLAKVKQSTRSMVKSLVGTVNWQAPELWHAHPKYDHKVDVFSCAMVFWEILQWYNPQKKYPWEGMNEHAIYEEVGAKKHRPSIAGLRKQWCPEVVDLMERMWAQDPHGRPTISEVVDDLETIVANL